MRRIEPITVKNPAAPLEGGFDDEGTPEPHVEWGDPADLWVDDAYQRPLAGKGLTLIRKVAAGDWCWRKFSMPSVSINADGRRVLIDGQHTATMALSRGIRRIPWLVVETVSQADQAGAFVGKNMDRTSITAMNEHRALVAAGDVDACQVERICKAVGINLCLTQKTKGWNPSDSIALASIRQLVKRRGDAKARTVLEVCVQAELAPISADHIKAVDSLLHDEEFSGLVKPEKMVALLAGAEGIKLAREAAAFAATHRVRTWRGLVAKIYQASTSRKRAAA